MNRNSCDCQPGDPVTVEAEFTYTGTTDAVIQQWTFYDRSPSWADDIVVRDYVPLSATLWRITIWCGLPEDEHTCSLAPYAQEDAEKA